MWRDACFTGLRDAALDLPGLTHSTIRVEGLLPLEETRRALRAVMILDWVVFVVVIGILVGTHPPKRNSLHLTVDEGVAPREGPAPPIAILVLTASSGTIPLPNLLCRQLPARTPGATA